MPARDQNTCYPSQAIAGTNTRHSVATPDFCTICNATNKHIQTGCHRGNTKTFEAAGCDTCNTVCDVEQSYCGGNAGTTQYIKDHADVGAYTMVCEQKDEFIFRNWTAPWWNDYQDDLLTADRMGLYTAHANGVSFPNGRAVTDPQNKGPFPYENVPFQHPAGSLVTGAKYNDLVNALAKFSSTISKVQGAAQVGCENATVIRASHARALRTGYNNAKFDTDVCDHCNTSAQKYPYGCECVSSSCMCSCGCDNPD